MTYPMLIDISERRWFKPRGIGLGVAITIGFLIVPYFAFCLSPIHVFAQDDTPEHLKVLEVRATIDRIVWTEKTAGERTVFQGPVTLYLHPGEQRVYLGTMNIPAGTYTKESSMSVALWLT